MNIKQMANQLEKAIASKIEILRTYGAEAAEAERKAQGVYLKMADLFEELKPVEYMVRFQNPDVKLNELFDELIRIKENSKINKEA